MSAELDILVIRLDYQTKALEKMAESLDRQAARIGELAAAVHGLADALAAAVSPVEEVEATDPNLPQTSHYLDGTPR